MVSQSIQEDQSAWRVPFGEQSTQVIECCKRRERRGGQCALLMPPFARTMFGIRRIGRCTSRSSRPLHTPLQTTRALHPTLSAANWCAASASAPHRSTLSDRSLAYMNSWSLWVKAIGQFILTVHAARNTDQFNRIGSNSNWWFKWISISWKYEYRACVEVRIKYIVFNRKLKFAQLDFHPCCGLRVACKY